MANEQAVNATFEFEPLREARNYRQALIQEFSAHLRGRVIEAGAGIGMMTDEMLRLSSITELLPVEPDPGFCALLREKYPKIPVVNGTLADVPDGAIWNAIISVNVLEHIKEDERELRRCHTLLKPGAGSLCLFVPARPEIYAPLDRDFGHFRRYTKKELTAKLERAGFTVSRIDYFNFIGYFAWWWNFCFLKQRHFDTSMVRIFDRFIFPIGHGLESRLLRPPIGQSLLAVARVPRVPAEDSR